MNVAKWRSCRFRLLAAMWGFDPPVPLTATPDRIGLNQDVRRGGKARNGSFHVLRRAEVRRKSKFGSQSSRMVRASADAWSTKSKSN
jgi:hypothetical protein